MEHENQSPASEAIEEPLILHDELSFPTPGENIEFPNGGNSDPIGSGGGNGNPPTGTAAAGSAATRAGASVPVPPAARVSGARAGHDAGRGAGRGV
jgi:hypothetical protein